MKPRSPSSAPFPGEAKFSEQFSTQTGVAMENRAPVATSFYHQNPYVPQKHMPTKQASKRARAAKRQGKKPTTQAGEFVREEMKKYKRGSGNVRSRKQAVAIGLSEARRSGVKLGTPGKGKASSATRKRPDATQRSARAARNLLLRVPAALKKPPGLAHVATAERADFGRAGKTNHYVGRHRSCMLRREITCSRICLRLRFGALP